MQGKKPNSPDNYEVVESVLFTQFNYSVLRESFLERYPPNFDSGLFTFNPFGIGFSLKKMWSINRLLKCLPTSPPKKVWGIVIFSTQILTTFIP